jgi:foldase protein PrsA
MRKLVTSTLCALLAASLFGCAPTPAKPGPISDTIAATVNGIPIMESRATNYIEVFRKSQDSLQSAEEWAKTLANAKLTPETLRRSVIDTFIEEQLVRMAAKEHGIEPDREIIDTTIENSMLKFSSKEVWLDELARVGYASEDEYRASLEDSYLRDTLKEAAIPLTEPTEEELRQVAPEESRKYAGKRSAHILFRAEGEQTAEDVKVEAELVKAQLDEGVAFIDLAATYSEDNTNNKSGGDVGWEKLSASFGSAYSTALEALAAGEYSQPIETSFGIHIILCTAEFNPVPNEPVPYESIPAEILKRIADEYVLEKQNEQFRDYINGLVAAADIIIAPMPDGLPYYVDMSLYVPSELAPKPPAPSGPTTGPDSGTGADEGKGDGEGAGPTEGQEETTEAGAGAGAEAGASATGGQAGADTAAAEKQGEGPPASEAESTSQ